MKDYKKILEGVVNIINTTEKSDIGFVNICTYIGENCPELQESEDERIRKWLIGYFRQYKEDGIEKYANGLKVESIIAWLEKQGKQEEPQVYETKDGEMITYSENKGYKVIEPKFHEGEWVVWDNKISCHIDNIYQGKESLMYTITDTNNMTRSYSVKDFDNNAHLWTLQDAKEGDVIYLQQSWKGHIIIYKGVIKERFRIFISAYCAYNSIVDAFCFADVSRYADTAYEDIMPATKEQRDLLFKKMKEAGYEWDEEKKELRKIEKQGEQKKDFRERYNKIADSEWFKKTHENMSVDMDEPNGETKEQVDGFDAELNAMLEKYEYLPKEELAECLEFYQKHLKQPTEAEIEKKDPILIRLDRIYDLLLEIRNNNILRQPYIETYPPHPYPIQPWYDTNKVYCDKASTETTTNTIEDERPETNM